MPNYRRNFYKNFNKTEAVKEDFQNENILFSSSTITYQCSLESGRTKAKLVQTGIRTLWTCRLCGATDWKIIAFSILHFTTWSFLFSYLALYFVFYLSYPCLVKVCNKFRVNFLFAIFDSDLKLCPSPSAPSEIPCLEWRAGFPILSTPRPEKWQHLNLVRRAASFINIACWDGSFWSNWSIDSIY